MTQVMIISKELKQKVHKKLMGKFKAKRSGFLRLNTENNLSIIQSQELLPDARQYDHHSMTFEMFSLKKEKRRIYI